MLKVFPVLCGLVLGPLALAEEVPGLPPGAVDRLGLGIPTGLALSPDGQFLAVATNIGVEIRDPKSLELLALLSPHEAWVTAIAFSPDGKKLAAAFANGAVAVWRQAWYELERFSFERPVTALAWSPEGGFLAVSVGDEVYLVDLDKRFVQKIWCEPEKKAQSLAFSPFGELAVLAENEIWLLEPSAWNVRWHRVFVTSLGAMTFLPSGALFVGFPVARTLDPRTGEEIESIPGLSIERVASGHGELLVGSSGPSIVLLGPEGPEWILAAHHRPIRHIALGEGVVYSIGEEGTLKAWDIRTKAFLRSLVRITHPVTALSLSPSGRKLAVGSEGDLAIWDLATKEVHLITDKFSLISDVYIDEEKAIVVDQNGLRVIDAKTGQTQRFFGAIRGVFLSPLRTARISADGQVAASVAMPAPIVLPSVYVVSLADLSSLFSLKLEFLAAVRYLALNSEGRNLAFATENRAEVWDIRSSMLLANFDIDQGRFGPLALSPSARFLALAVTDDETREECLRVEIWDVPAKTRLSRIDGVLANSFAFSPDEKTLAVGTAQGEILLFDLAEPSRAKKILRGHTAQVFALVFSPDGTLLYSGSSDGTILIWDLKEEQESIAHRLAWE